MLLQDPGWCSLETERPSSQEKLAARCPSSFFYRERTVWRGPSEEHQNPQLLSRAIWHHDWDLRHYTLPCSLLRKSRPSYTAEETGKRKLLYKQDFFIWDRPKKIHRCTNSHATHLHCIFILYIKNIHLYLYLLNLYDCSFTVLNLIFI